MRKLETVIDLLEAMKEAHGWSSDSELARALGVPQPTVACWRSGSRTPGGEHALKIAESLDISPLLVIAIAEAERAKNIRSQRIWREVAEQVARGTVTAFGALAVLAATYGAAGTAGCILRQMPGEGRPRSSSSSQPAP